MTLPMPRFHTGTIGGVPHFLEDGKSLGMNFPYVYATGSEPFRDAGYNVFRFSLPTGWCGPHRYDYAETDEVIRQILHRNPEARLLPMVWWSGPDEASWWPDYCPTEQCVSVDPRSGVTAAKWPFVPRNRRESALQARYHGRSPSYVSFAGPTWRREVCEAARSLVRHLDQSAFADRIIGFYVGGGHSYEWMYWGSFIWDGLCDYSKCMLRYFRDWLWRKYGSDQELARHWNRVDASIIGAELPSAQRRLAVSPHLLFDPATDQDVIDLHLCTSDLVADTAIDLCRAMKSESCHARALGIFHGYGFTHSDGKGLSNPQLKGHLSVQRILDADVIDFVASPYDYSHRGVGGVHTAQGTAASVLARSKPYISSVDNAVFGDDGGGPMIGTRPASWEQSNAILLRDFGTALCTGMTMSWVDLKGGSFSAAPTREALFAIRRLENTLADAPRSSEAQVALVWSSRSQACMQYQPRLSIPLLSVQKQQGAGSLGAPYDCIEEDDVIRGIGKRYRFYVFLNSFYHSAESRAALRGALQRQAASALWIYAPGCLCETGIRPACADSLCGVAMRQVTIAGPLQVTVTGEPEQPLYGLGIDADLRRTEFGLESGSNGEATTAFVPLPIGDDQVLGHLRGTNLPGLVVHDEGTRRDVISSAPAVPAPLLRQFAAAAGVHIYSEHGDYVTAGGHYIMLYSRCDERRALRLPGNPTSLLNVLTGEQIAVTRSRAVHQTPKYTAALWLVR